MSTTIVYIILWNLNPLPSPDQCEFIDDRSLSKLTDLNNLLCAYRMEMVFDIVCTNWVWYRKELAIILPFNTFMLEIFLEMHFSEIWNMLVTVVLRSLLVLRYSFLFLCLRDDDDEEEDEKEAARYGRRWQVLFYYIFCCLKLCWRWSYNDHLVKF